MNNKNCNLIKDLLPLYIENLLSIESENIVKNHLENCEECREELIILKENDSIQIEISENKIEQNGEKLLNKIKKSQDRIKYTFILFSMILAVSNGYLSSGFMSTIPLVIIIPFILTLFFEESKIILLVGICINLILSIAIDSVPWQISTLLLVGAILSGIYFGKSIKSIAGGK